MSDRLRYRLLTGIDDASFCRKISEALDDGYELYGSPTMSSVDGKIMVGQAVVLVDHVPDRRNSDAHNGASEEEVTSSDRR